MNYSKVIIIPSFLIMFSSFPMKRPGISVFLKANGRKASIVSAIRLHDKSRATSVIKSSPIAATPLLYNNNNKNFSTFSQPYLAKNISSQYSFVGPLIAGIALGGLAKSCFEQKKVYADSEDKNLLDELISAISQEEGLIQLKKIIQKNSSSKQEYRKLVLENLSSLLDKPLLFDCLTLLFEGDELINNYGELIAGAVCKKINDSDSIAILALKLIQQDCNSTFTNVLAQWVANNIGIYELNSKRYQAKIDLLEKLLESNFENRIKLGKSICEQYTSVKEVFNNEGFSLFLNNTKHNEISEHFLTLITEQFGKISSHQSENFYSNIDSFLDKRVVSSEVFVSIALLNLPLFCNLFFCSMKAHTILNPPFWLKLLTNTAKEMEKLSEALMSERVSLGKTKYGTLLLWTSTRHDDNLRKQWVNDLHSNIDDISLESFAIVTKNKPCDLKIRESILTSPKKPSLQNRIERMLKVISYKETCPNDCIDEEISDNNQTNIHLKQLSAELLKKYYDKLAKNNRDAVLQYSPDSITKFFGLSDCNVEGMINKIYAKEKELQSDYYTFVHGQRSEYLPCEELHTFLQGTVHNQKQDDNYLLLHIKETDSSAEKIKQQKELRNKLLKNGRETDESRQHLLFVNWAYFANFNNLGSSSAYYVFHNNNNTDNVTITTEDVFKVNHIEFLYPKYKEKIEQLQQEFKTLTTYGTCMMVAIPKSTINKHIYLAKRRGYKSTLSIDGVGKTDDMEVIMETLINEPEKIDDIDQIEFCIPMTYDKKGALNPESGIKVFAFTAVDQEKLDAYYARQKALFAEIKKDLETAQ